MQTNEETTSDPPGIDDTGSNELQLNHINCESSDTESDTDNITSVNMITVENDYEPIIYEQPFTSHIYENQLELLHNYYIGPNTNNTQITQKVNEINTAIKPDKKIKKMKHNAQTQKIFIKIYKKKTTKRKKKWTIAFLLESPRSKEFQPPDLEIDFLIDSGAESNIINISTWNEIKTLHPNLTPLETSCKLATAQRSTLVPQEQWNKTRFRTSHLNKLFILLILRLLGILEQYEIISPVNKEEQPKGNTFINPVIILAKVESLKIVLDARYLNSLIDKSKCNWPIEPIQVILTKINGKYFTTADMNSAYNQMPLDEQSRRLTQFVIENQEYEFNRLFYGICTGPAAFSAFMSKTFRPLLLKKNAIIYLDDVFMQSQTKDEKITVLEQYHKIVQNENLKAAPDTSHFFLTRVKFLGHDIGRNNITPLKSRIDAIQKLQPPTNKKKIQEFLGMLNFLSKYAYKMQLYLKPFYNFLRQQNNFEWTTEHQSRFEEIKNILTEQISNTIPDPNQPFYAMCDASNFGIGAALLQSHNGLNKMSLISANSRLFTQTELRFSTLLRECTAIIYTLTEYEFLILGSKHPTVLFIDHIPIIFLFTQKSNPNHRVYRFQIILMKFPNLHIVWTAGKNLALPDTLSRNTPPELLTRKTTIEIPQNTKFYLAKDETSPRLECKYAVKTDIDQSQINNLQLFPLYLDCQNNHYQVDLHGKSTFKPIPYSQWIKNNNQQKRIKQHSHKKDLFSLIEKENLTSMTHLTQFPYQN